MKDVSLKKIAEVQDSVWIRICKTWKHTVRIALRPLSFLVLVAGLLFAACP